MSDETRHNLASADVISGSGTRLTKVLTSSPPPDPGAEAEQSEDIALLEAVRRGDDEAFALLWHRHHRAALAAARTVSADLADDLVAEAFLRVLRALRAGKGPRTNFRSYLVTAVRTSFIDGYRKNWRTVAVGEVSELEALLAPAVEPDVLEDADALAQAWLALSHRDRALLWATAVDGFSTAELAREYDVRANTVAVWAHRARTRLRELLTRALEDVTGRAESCAAAHAAMAADAQPAPGPDPACGGRSPYAVCRCIRTTDRAH